MAPLTELPASNHTRFSPPRVVTETGSTNADLLLEAVNGAAEGAVLVAEHQTAGRGRQQRAWHDEPGNAMLMSFLLRPKRENAPLMPLLAGVAACEALGHLCGREPTGGPAGLKWPNDVLAPDLGERKLAGILAESSTPVAAQASTGPTEGHLIVVIGTGMNLRWGSPPPKEIQERSATVEDLTSGPVERDEVVALYLRHVELWLRRLEIEGSAALLTRYREHCLTLGREVSFSTSTAEYSGVAADVSDRGTLLLDTADGRVELHSGDAHHRR